ncbi:hypothetical protein GE061_011448 [Apolygus lucorum]|uniref:Uncharacterized protein n=1 Tax=Apolygus lucorum TaxID=248454 RepID=A0A6A4IR69_APOLU|nr:hypothetical protein GE061_011448 [Apolygus lucorum]
MPRNDLYLIESKPIAVCIQVLLEFLIFMIAALLWLTWITKDLKVESKAEAKSLAFSLPGYMQGWICLMVARLFGSRLKEKFCFSFYLASGIRFMTSAAVLFPEFTINWFPVVYGLIGLLCFITTIFHIVTQTKPERRQVRRLIRPDGTLEKEPVNEMMTLQQLEAYRDAIRNYMEKQDKKKDSDSDEEPYYVKSLSVISVRLSATKEPEEISVTRESIPSTSMIIESRGKSFDRLMGSIRSHSDVNPNMATLIAEQLEQERTAKSSLKRDESV